MNKSIHAIFLLKKTHYFKTEAISRIETKTGYFYLNDKVQIHFVDGKEIEVEIKEKAPLQDILNILQAYGIPEDRLKALQTFISVQKKNAKKLSAEDN